MPLVLLIWAFTLFYAMAESGLLLTQHRKLSTVGALLGKTPTGAGGATLAPAAGGGVAAGIVGYAQGALGKPYGWGQPPYCVANPSSYDCSGLVRCAVTAATASAVNLPHNAALQYLQLARWRVKGNTPASWAPGDLVYYFIPGETGSGEPAHCAVYIGGGKVIDAPHTGTSVRIDNWQLGRVMGAFRIPESVRQRVPAGVSTDSQTRSGAAAAVGGAP